jgi:hypothetical protein
MIKHLVAAFVGIAILLPSIAYPQTCSCAGPPLLSTIEFHSTPKGTWKFGLTHEYNSQAKLITGNEILDDDTRTRSTRTLLVEISRGLTGRLSFTSVLSLVQKSRVIRVSVIGQDKLLTRGLGDGIFLMKYSIIPWDVFTGRQLEFGLGLKAPLGSSSLDLNDIRVATDMQPGTGSWDGIFWGNFVHRMSRDSDASLNVNASYNLTGEGDFGYEFGDDFTANLGILYNADNKAILSGGIRFRKTWADRQNASFEVPNTGGRWLFLAAGLSADFKNHFTWRLSGQLPIYHNLEGTQLSTSYVYSMSIFYTWERIN